MGLAEVLRGYSMRSDIIPGLVVAIPLHFLWNFIDPLIALLIILPFNLIIIVRMVRAAQRDEFNWSYETKAPIE